MLKKYQPLFLVLLAYVIVGVFYPSITADFVNLDDNVMVLGNELIKSFSFSNLKEMFTTPYYKLYHPLVTLSFAFEYLFCKLDPFLYHIDNILLHIFNTLLVFFIIKRLSKSFFISYFTALIFAVHPVHVEVVSWVSSRKDTLYSFFFLLSILTYMKMDDSKRYKELFIISVGSFLFSCLSKPTAVTLPLFLMLIDFCTGKMAFRKIKRYIPYIIISAFFVYIAIHFHYSPEEKAISTLFFKYVNFVSAHFNILFYGYKFVLPTNLSVLYPYFFGVHSMMPWYVLYSPFVLYTIILFVFLSLEYTRKIFFGFFFFFFALLPSSGVMPTGVAPVADRYAYLAIIGLAYLAAESLYYLAKKSVYLKIAVICFSVSLLGTWSYLTYSRNMLWRDSVMLMTEAINYAPDSAAHAYLTRGIIHKGADRIAEAESDLKKSFDIAKDNVTIYFHKAHLKQVQKKYDEAIALYSKVPENYYDYGIVINNVALILGEQEKNEQAIKFLKKQIAKKGEDDSFVEYFYSNLALLYFKEKNYDESLKYVKLAKEKNPTNYAYYLQMMVIYNEKDDFKNFESAALEGMEKTHDDVNIVNELARKYFTMGRYDDVNRLLFKEQKLNSDNAEGFFLLGNIAAMHENFKAALIYYTMAIETSKENGEYYFRRAAVFLILGDYQKAKLNADIAEKKGVVIDDVFKEGLASLKEQIDGYERKLEEEKKFSDKFDAVREYRANAKKIQEENIAADITAVKNREINKAAQEQQIFDAMKAAKEKETAGKISQESKISSDIKEIKISQEKELAGRMEQEDKISSDMKKVKEKEVAGRSIQESSIYAGIKERKISQEKEAAGKASQENKISSDMKVAKEKELAGKKIQEEQISGKMTEIKKEKEEKGKLVAEEKTSGELAAIKNTEKRKAIAEELTGERIAAIKNMEERKKIEEQNTAEELRIIKEKETRKIELANSMASGVKTGKMRDVAQVKTLEEIKTIKIGQENKKEQENKIFALLGISKWKEFIRKQTEEENTAKRLREQKERGYRALMAELKGKKEQEDIIYAGITVFKNRESLRKQIQEEAVALSLKMRKNLSKKELEAKREHESKVFAMLKLLKTRESLRKRIAEEDLAIRLKAIHAAQIRKSEREKVIAEQNKTEFFKSFDIEKSFSIDESEDDKNLYEDSAFNI